VSWLLDGLEVTVVGALGRRLGRDETPASGGADRLAASATSPGRLLGASSSAGSPTTSGRKRMFSPRSRCTCSRTVLTAFSFSFASFAFCRVPHRLRHRRRVADQLGDRELIPARGARSQSPRHHGTFWIRRGAGTAMSISSVESFPDKP